MTTILLLCLAAQDPEGASRVWVSAGQWPNARTHETFARDAVRLYGAENGTAEQKALAVYTYALRVLGHGGDYFQGPPGAEEPVWDSWMIAHVYPKALCEWWGWLLIDLWKAQNGNWSFDPKTAVARKVGLNAPGETPPLPNAGSHVQAALRWTDADGVDRWHLFDGNVGFYARSRAGHIATPEEIRAEYPDLLTRPTNPPHPYFVLSKKHGDPESDPAFRAFLGNTYPFQYSGSQRRTLYRTDFDLRVGESLRRQWGDDGKAVAAKRHKEIAVLANLDGAAKYLYPDGTPKDPYNFPVQRPYFKTYPGLGLNKPFGNAYHVYVPDLKTLRGAVSSAGLVPGLRAAKEGVEGEIVYPIRTIYPFAESFVRGDAVLKPGDRVALDLSLDEGRTWIPVHEAKESGPFAVDLGKGRWDQGLPSTYNMPDRDSQYLDYTNRAKFDQVRFTGFQYRVRVRVLAKTRAADAGLDSLRFENTLQCNIGMLPTLLPGSNRITVEAGSLAPGAALRVEYAWMEGGETKTRVETARTLPHVFDIEVKEKDPLKVKCLYQTTSVVPR